MIVKEDPRRTKGDMDSRTETRINRNLLTETWGKGNLCKQKIVLTKTEENRILREQKSTDGKKLYQRAHGLSTGADPPDLLTRRCVI